MELAGQLNAPIVEAPIFIEIHKIGVIPEKEAEEEVAVAEDKEDLKTSFLKIY